ncbi:hypothetical protein D3C71_1723470 [compost metagenome]
MLQVHCRAGKRQMVAANGLQQRAALPGKQVVDVLEFLGLEIRAQGQTAEIDGLEVHAAGFLHLVHDQVVHVQVAVRDLILVEHPGQVHELRQQAFRLLA